MNIPQYEGLSIQDILNRVGQSMDFQSFMPCVKELPKLPKQWISNVAYFVIGKDFANWVMELVEYINQKLAVENNLMINVDPAVAQAWQMSTAVSCKCMSTSTNHSYLLTCLFSHYQSATVLESTFSKPAPREEEPRPKSPMKRRRPGSRR